jgi:hypothetical protein
MVKCMKCNSTLNPSINDCLCQHCRYLQEKDCLWAYHNNSNTIQNSINTYNQKFILMPS